MPIFECSRCNEMTYSAYSGVPSACADCGSATLRVIDGAFDEARRVTRDLGPGDHASLVFDDVDSVAPFCARYLTEGVEAGEHVVAALPQDLDESVRGLLAAEVAVEVEWKDAEEIYGEFDADRIAGAYREVIESEPRATRILAGPPSLDGIDVDEFDRYERIAHGIVISLGVTAICLCDTRVSSPAFVDVAARRHTLAVSDGAVRRNERFEYAPA